MAPPEVPTESQEHEKVERESTEDARMRAQAHIQRIFAEQLVMSGAATAEASKVLAEALKLAQDRRPSSKYFTSAPKLQTVSEIDKAAQNGSQEDKDRLAIELCGDFFLLCMALKQRPGLPTSEDANVDWSALDRLLGNLSPEASEKSLEALSATADAIAASEELQTPSLLRAVMVMLAHPGLGEPGDFEVVHDLSPDEKKSLLQFCTGCDRAPVGGLGRLQLILSRAGPDSDVLPTVHTCFNHLLLPDYKSKEKLESLLRLAIQHCHGFGLM